MTFKQILIEEAILDNIVQESNKYENIETGGLLFGKSVEEYAIIQKVINFQGANRTEFHFEIDEEFAISETKRMEQNGLEYIGNWHKHLGYGGPSQGDDEQAKIFLVQNQHKKNYLSLIIDSCDNDKYQLIATNYYFDKKKFIRQQIDITCVSSLNEMQGILKDKKINALRFMSGVARYLDKNTGKKFTILSRSELHRHNMFESNTRYILSLDSKYTGNNDIESYPFISFPNAQVYLHDKVCLGISTKDYTTGQKLIEYEFSDLLFNKIDILSEVKNIMINPAYLNQLQLVEYRRPILNGEPNRPQKTEASSNAVVDVLQKIKKNTLGVFDYLS